MPSTYGWIITKDHQADPDAAEGTNSNAKGVIGPREIPEQFERVLRNGGGRAFRMYDDDGELYYSGRAVGDEVAVLGVDAFGPLDDFGTPNAGATEIRYHDGHRWAAL